MGWDQFDQDLEAEAPKSGFIKWKEDEVHQMVYLGPGDPIKYMDSFKGQDPRAKWMGNFAVKEDIMGEKQWTPVIVDMGWGFWRSIREANALAEDQNNTHIYNIKREGTGMKTKYVVAHLRAVTEEEAPVLEALETADLNEVLKAKTERNN